MSYALLKHLLEFVEEYQNGNSSSKIEDFTIWLNNKLFKYKVEDEHSIHDELVIAFKIMLLSKELKKDTKGVLAESNVSSLDEYSFLLHLLARDSYRKMEIIDMHSLEAPTGIEIIKRLLKNDLVEEFADAEDKRAKRIRITERGKNEVQQIKPKIDLIFREFTQMLDLNEKIQINGILNKMLR